ncbi:MAG: AmmeMemoRadiSam system protein A [Chloroflexi bacterium]|jgi:uncharacterized protein|nr:AmmeMemoRadiSam system protein A [Chloroflexota bacterium]
MASLSGKIGLDSIARKEPDWEKRVKEDQLSPAECDQLLKLARQTLEIVLAGTPLPELILEDYPEKLRLPGATFVTLTKSGQLRGCIGTLEAFRPLVEDTRQHAIAAATQDYRFPPVQADELPAIAIEISRLTSPVSLEYASPDDLLARLRPGVDGVLLRDGSRRATFLPQVWGKIPSPVEFLNQLCLKMGNLPDAWRERNLIIEIYQVEEFHE